MNIDMSDIMLHIDEDLSNQEQSALEHKMREHKGVVGLGYHDTQPHLMIVEYDKDATTPKELLRSVSSYGLHAELVGFL